MPTVSAVASSSDPIMTLYRPVFPRISCGDFASFVLDMSRMGIEISEQPYDMANGIQVVTIKPSSVDITREVTSCFQDVVTLVLKGRRKTTITSSQLTVDLDGLDCIITRTLDGQTCMLNGIIRIVDENRAVLLPIFN